MNVNKHDIFVKHEVLLQVVYYLGAGIIFVTQLYQLMSKHKTQIWRDIKELHEAGLIDKIFFNKHCVLKIKAYSIQVFKEKENVNSIEVTAYKMQKSAMISAIILKNFGHLCKNAEEILNYTKRYTNFVYSEYTDMYFLEQIQRHMNQKGMNTDKLIYEINNPSDEDFSKYKMHLNMYFEKYRIKDGEYIISIAILDLSSVVPTITAKRIYDLYMKCDALFMNNLRIENELCIHYDFVFYVRDSLRQEYVLKQINKMNQYLKQMNLDLSRISLCAINLDITSALFSDNILFI